MFKNPNLAEIFTNLAEIKKEVELRGVHRVCFFQVYSLTLPTLGNHAPSLLRLYIGLKIKEISHFIVEETIPL